MVRRYEGDITPVTQEKLVRTLGEFGVYGERPLPQGRMGRLSSNQYMKRLSGVVDKIPMEAHVFWTPIGTDVDILLRGTVTLEREDLPGTLIDYVIRHADPLEDVWELERFTRPLVDTAPQVSDDALDTIDLIKALDAQDNEWQSIEESRQLARTLGLATPSENEAVQLLNLTECNLAFLRSRAS